MEQLQQGSMDAIDCAAHLVAVYTFIKSLLQALAGVHGHVVHNDLKLSNLMLDIWQGRVKVKVSRPEALALVNAYMRV